ncbi:hypothetical protein IW262DRAFT_1299951 [Armillaria fumosa]|nr:hypothetical protein IW262DRAFT_1299951 [Armillaria fumosa]
MLYVAINKASQSKCWGDPYLRMLLPSRLSSSSMFPDYADPKIEYDKNFWQFERDLEEHFSGRSKKHTAFSSSLLNAILLPLPSLALQLLSSRRRKSQATRRFTSPPLACSWKKGRPVIPYLQKWDTKLITTIQIRTPTAGW